MTELRSDQKKYILQSEANFFVKQNRATIKKSKPLNSIQEARSFRNNLILKWAKAT